MSMEKITMKKAVFKFLSKKFNHLKRIDPKYYVIVIGLLIIAILFKKYRLKILAIIKLVFNI